MEKILEKLKSQKVKLIISVSIIAILAIIFIIRFAIYQKEGEKNMPYTISKIIVVSRANKYNKATENTDKANQENSEEEQVEDSNSENQAEEIENALWNFDLIQTNDVYISIEKNDENIKKNEKIKSVSIENIKIIESPAKGTIKAFMPNSLDGEKYSYTNDFSINNSLTYRAAGESNFQNLQISEQGGVIGFSLANTELEKFVSNDEEEISYNGTLLSKIGITDNDVKSKISFDIVIELDNGKKYSGNVVLDINCDGLVENGSAQQEITEFSNVIFKRI